MSSSTWSFITIVLVGMVIMTVVLGIAKAGVVWYKTGDYKPMIEATLGQVVYWDNQIYNSIQYMKDPNLAENVPGNFRTDLQGFLIKQLMFYIMTFVVIGFLIFKAGRWIVSQSNTNPTTDIILVLVVIGVFAFAEVLYGGLMHKTWQMPFRGLIELFKPETWSYIIDRVTI